MNEVQRFVGRERLSRRFYDALFAWWAASCTAGMVVLGSINFCITWPPAPLWRIIVCSAFSVLALAYAAIATAVFFKADDALRAWDAAELDWLEAEATHGPR
jgi:hypothetical protein